MSEPHCPGCRKRDAEIAALRQQLAALEARLRDLEARLGQNSSNSSLPPSADPPQAPKPVLKQPTGRRTGAQPGHPPHLRCRLPADRVRHTVRFLPSHCRCCQAPLPADPGADDPPPSWHQVAELPEVTAEVTEYQGHARTCPCCGTRTHAPIPAEIRAHSIGPKLAATLIYLSGRLHLSKRAVEEVTETVFEVPVALGTVGRLEQEMSQALAQPHQEVAVAVRSALVKNVDETGWKLAGRLCWLWAAVTQGAALFVLHARRGATGLTALLGEAVGGIIGSDRWSAYHRLEVSRRQVCWAHLKRDFQGLVDRGGAGAAIGQELLALLGVLFGAWYKVRDGTRSRHWLGRLVEDGIRPDVAVLLRRGAGCGCAKTEALCRNLLELEPALWTFVSVEGVEPTNNVVERALRPAVLWRKRSFGCQSEAGCRFVERLLTVVQTLRLRKQRVLPYLYEAVRAHRANLPAPALLAAG
jgi:transposase